MKGIHLERIYPHPVECLWEAIATSSGLAAWLMPNTFSPVVGHRFQFRWKKMPGWRGVVDCEVTALTPKQLLSFRWQGEERHRPTQVTLRLEAVSGGTKLVLDHDGFRGFGGFVSRAMMKGGWKSRMLDDRLPRALDTLAAHGIGALVPLQP